MATLAELQEALVNADRAGATDDARKLANAIHEMRSAAPEQQKPQQSESGLSAAKRIIMGLADPIHGGAQLLTNALPKGLVDAGNRANNWLADKTGMVAKLPEGGVDQQVRDREAAYKQARGPDAGIDWMRMLGNVASPANLAMAAAGPEAAATTLGRIGVGSGMGALSSATSPVGEGDFAAEKLKQMGVGAVGGAALPAAVAGLSRMVSPKASTDPALALLRAEGVKPTVGQTLGGWANQTEEKLQSLPIMGDAIRWSRGQAREQFNEAAINRAVKPIGEKVQGAGVDAVNEAHGLISNAYQRAEAQLGNFQLDRQAQRELLTLKTMAQKLPPKERRTFDEVWGYLDNEVSPNGSLLADGFQRFKSKAGAEAASFQGSPDAYQKKAGDAIKELQRIVVEAGKRANPDASAAYKKADEAFANLVRVEGASVQAKGSGGVFTPGQLLTAVRQSDRSARDNATGRGTALMQDLASAGQSKLGNKVPDSGTAQRLMMGTAGFGSYLVDPAIPASLIGGAAMYSPPAQALLRGLVASRPQAAQPIAGLLNQSAPMLGPAGGLLGLEFLNQ